ncbi:hypothetical protein BDN72DRAFT_672200 [Pluteus cervinus]|uniref:Uncharacterized protein n=1 Tax=Pluteus cervinus TaxID=181527 RepID=A0ACD3BAK9_9AGAR|nr:hypothetical protein BDN72DRAFT_672200 [Pluteus cervinus]
MILGNEFEDTAGYWYASERQEYTTSMPVKAQGIHSPTLLKQHEKYYHATGSLVIRVGLPHVHTPFPAPEIASTPQIQNILFRIWDGLFYTHSEKFSRLYLLATNLEDSKHNTDQNPLVIEDIEPSKFEKLLGVINPLTIGRYQASS